MPATAYFQIEKLAARVNAKLSRRGITARQAAEEIGISTATMSRIRDGVHPSTENMARVIGWLGCTADEFVVRYQ